MAEVKYDLLLTGAHVLTMDEDLAQHPGGFVAVKDGRIAAVGPADKQPPATAAAEVIDCTDCIAIPGLINCHTHLPMSYFRGIADDLPLMKWLTEHIFPAENKHLSPEFVYEATQFAAAECIKNGVTCVNDMYLFATDIARSVADAGLRGYIGEGVIKFPTASAPTWEDGKRLTEELIATWKDHPLITPTVCCHAPYTCTPELLETMHGIAEDNGLLFHVHLHETEFEADMVDWSLKDESPVHSLRRIGVLGPRTVAAHCVWVDDHDIRHMREEGCGVAHCPTSNMKLGSGIAPVHSMIEAELPVGVGTDGAASNNNLDMLEELHIASLGAKAVYKNPEVIPAEAALSFATSRAAALLHTDEIGVLAAGRQADITIVRHRGLHQYPYFHHAGAIYSQLIYSAQGPDVRDTIVAGKVLMRNRRLTQLDEEALMARAQEWVDTNYPS